MKKIFLDCDLGVDDSIALLYLLKRKDVKIMGISTGFGNTSAKQAAINVASILKLAEVDYHIPIGIGAEASLARGEPSYPTHIHGDNGIGNVELPLDEEREFIDGVELLVNVIQDNPYEITLITLGRYTNLAKALDINDKLPELTKEVYSMGGTIYEAGNAGPFAEANIIGDAEAADKVFAAGFNLNIAGLDVTLNTWLTWSELGDVEQYLQTDKDKRIYEYIKSAKEYYMGYNSIRGFGINIFPIHDPSAILLALEPQLYTTRKMKARVEYQGKFTYGQIVVDNRLHGIEAEYVNFALEVDSKKAVDTLLNGLFFADTL